MLFPKLADRLPPLKRQQVLSGAFNHNFNGSSTRGVTRNLFFLRSTFEGNVNLIIGLETAFGSITNGMTHITAMRTFTIPVRIHRELLGSVSRVLTNNKPYLHESNYRPERIQRGSFHHKR